MTAFATEIPFPFALSYHQAKIQAICAIRTTNLLAFVQFGPFDQALVLLDWTKRRNTGEGTDHKPTWG